MLTYTRALPPALGEVKEFMRDRLFIPRMRGPAPRQRVAASALLMSYEWMSRVMSLTKAISFFPKGISFLRCFRL
jgi:hypothetical protein